MQVGADFIVGYRMGVEDFTAGGVTIEESRIAAVQLTSSVEIDYLSLTQGNFDTIAEHLPEAHYPAATYVDLHAQIKVVVPHVPIVTSSRIQTPAQAETIIAGGKADMGGLCRALVADPYWPSKAALGQANDITPCITCNRCWGLVVESKRIACTVIQIAGPKPTCRLKHVRHERTASPSLAAVPRGRRRRALPWSAVIM